MSTSTFRPGGYTGQQVRTDDGCLWQWTGVRWVYRERNASSPVLGRPTPTS